MFNCCMKCGNAMRQEPDEPAMCSSCLTRITEDADRLIWGIRLIQRYGRVTLYASHEKIHAGTFKPLSKEDAEVMEELGWVLNEEQGPCSWEFMV